MALMKASEVPTDAVALSEIEATKYVWELVAEWGSIADTWALRYGSVALGGLNALSGVLINRHFRQKLKLGTYGYFSCVVPISVMPGLLTSLFHRHLISTEMLLMKREGCPLCYEIRSAAIQLSLGLAYPMVLAPVSALLFANRYSTYRVPQLNEGIKVMFKFLRKITRPFNGTLATLAITQFVASSVITHFEMKNHFTLRRKMAEIESNFEKKKDRDNLR